MAHKVKIKIRAFTYGQLVADPVNPDNETLVAQVAMRGDEVEVNDADYAKGVELGAFAEADGEPVGGGSLVGRSVVDLSDDELDELLETESPNVGETVALADGDPESAQRILDAEVRVTGDEPRQGVIEGLEKVIGG